MDDVHPVRQKFRDAHERLQNARAEYSRAQTELIDAQRAYDVASKAFGREFMADRHLTIEEQSVMEKALRRTAKPIYEAK